MFNPKSSLDHWRPENKIPHCIRDDSVVSFRPKGEILQPFLHLILPNGLFGFKAIIRNMTAVTIESLQKITRCTEPVEVQFLAGAIQTDVEVFGEQRTS